MSCTEMLFFNVEPPKIKQRLHKIFFRNEIIEIMEGEVISASVRFGDNFSNIYPLKLRYSNCCFYDNKTGESVRESNILGWENMKIYETQIINC